MDYCNNCNCLDCTRNRAIYRQRGEGFILRDKAPIQRPRWQDAEPANEQQAKAWLEAINSIFNENKLTAIHLPGLIHAVCYKMNVRPENYHRVGLQIERFIRECGHFDALSKVAFRKEAKYMELTPATNVPDLITGKLPSNYTCKGCGNTNLNSSEKSCWKCGKEVGT